MKKILLIICIMILGVMAVYYRYFLLMFFTKDLPETVKNNTIIQNIEKQVLAPEPLRADRDYGNTYLTKSGVISITNQQRFANGNLPALRENALLNKAAQNKMNDMFANQYFEHVSPTGKGPSELAEDVSYEFVTVGENLALGNFKDDATLVQAWMDSPGHRANILNVKFQEIGVAVGQGMFEGKKVWIAVQEFGKPAVSCPIVDKNLKQQIETYKHDIEVLEVQLKNKKQEMKAMNPTTQDEYEIYNRRVSEYNDLVKIYNNKIDLLKQATTTYNTQVNAFNVCVQQ